MTLRKLFNSRLLYVAEKFAFLNLREIHWTMRTENRAWSIKDTARELDLTGFYIVRNVWKKINSPHVTNINLRPCSDEKYMELAIEFGEDEEVDLMFDGMNRLYCGIKYIVPETKKDNNEPCKLLLYFIPIDNLNLSLNDYISEGRRRHSENIKGD